MKQQKNRKGKKFKSKNKMNTEKLKNKNILF